MDSTPIVDHKSACLDVLRGLHDLPLWHYPPQTQTCDRPGHGQALPNHSYFWRRQRCPTSIVPFTRVLDVSDEQSTKRSTSIQNQVRRPYFQPILRRSHRKSGHGDKFTDSAYRESTRPLPWLSRGCGTGGNQASTPVSHRFDWPMCICRILIVSDLKTLAEVRSNHTFRLTVKRRIPWDSSTLWPSSRASHPLQESPLHLPRSHVTLVRWP